MGIAEKLRSLSRDSNSSAQIEVSAMSRKNIFLVVKEDLAEPRFVKVSANVGSFTRTFTHIIASPWDYATALDEVETVLSLNIAENLDIFDDVKNALEVGIRESLNFKFNN